MIKIIENDDDSDDNGDNNYDDDYDDDDYDDYDDDDYHAHGHAHARTHIHTHTYMQILLSWLLLSFSLTFGPRELSWGTLKPNPTLEFPGIPWNSLEFPRIPTRGGPDAGGPLATRSGVKTLHFPLLLGPESSPGAL